MLQMDSRKSASIFFIGMGVLIAVFVVVSIAKKPDGKEEQAPVQSVMIDLPDPEVPEMSDSKSDEITLRRSGRKNNIEAYYDSRESLLGEPAERNEDPMKSIGGGTSTNTQGNSGNARTSEELFGSGASPSVPNGNRAETYRETPAQREARHQKRREEALDLANEISGRQEGGSDDGARESDRIDLTPPQSSATRQSGVISSLSGSGGGVTSLEQPSGIYSCESDHPFRCVFPKDEKIKSGQRVSVRLLEDMLVGSYAIPKNTHLQAYVTIDSRLELEISSIEIGGRIIPLGCVAYDTDGVKGIYCPEAGEAKRTVKTSGLSAAGSLVGGRVGRLAGEIVNTGVSIAQNSAGERTVTVPAGYSFFIVKKKQP